MTGTIVTSNFTVMIENVQIDIWYNFSNSSMEVFIDGQLIISSTFRPNHVALNYSNVLTVAVYYFEVWRKRELLKQKQL